MKKPALKSLSDKQLLSQLEKIRRREHLSTLEILLHLNEIERRKLDLKLGYSSLYDYCVKHLGYSSSGAGRRVAVARCVRRHPDVLDLLRSQRLSVTGISLVASVLNERNKKELLESIQGKSQGEIDAIAARYRRPIALRDRVKPVRVVVPEPAATTALAGKAGAPSIQGACEKDRYSHNGSSFALNGGKTGGDGSGGPTHARSEQKLLVQFLANPEFMKKYEEVRALLSQRLSDTSFENVFEALIHEFLERHCPIRRKTRRDKRTGAHRSAGEAGRDSRKTTPRRPCREPAQRKPAPRRPRSAATQKNKALARIIHQARPKHRSRRIPAAVRDKVFARDKGRCTYVGKTGKRCGSAQALQIDHIEPFTRGGSDTPSNLRLLCAKHNRLAAREMFGENFMKRFRPREQWRLP